MTRGEKFRRKFERASTLAVEPCPHGIADRPCETCDPLAYKATASFRHLGTILEWRHLPRGTANTARTVVRLHCYTCHKGHALEVLEHAAEIVPGSDPVRAARETVREVLRKAGCPHKPPPL